MTENLYPMCPHGPHEWHGLPSWGCKGSFTEDDMVIPVPPRGESLLTPAHFARHGPLDFHAVRRDESQSVLDFVTKHRRAIVAVAFLVAVVVFGEFAS